VQPNILDGLHASLLRVVRAQIAIGLNFADRANGRMASERARREEERSWACEVRDNIQKLQVGLSLTPDEAEEIGKGVDTLAMAIGRIPRDA
jgi:hypothetical protein